MRRKPPLPIALGLLVGAAALAPAIAVEPPAEPARLQWTVAPEPVAPGADLAVELRLEAIPGIKINRYPRIRLKVPGAEGLVSAAEASLGSDTPPPPDRLAHNYFDRVDPLRLRLVVDPAAAPGKHEVEARLTYFFCMPEKNFCAPKRAAVRFPITVR